MNPDEPATLLEEECAALLAVCDDLLAQGNEPVVPDDSSLPPEVKGRLQRGLDCLRRLEQVWPRRSSVSLRNPPLPLPLPLPRCAGNPKSEIRNPKEIPNNKSEIPNPAVSSIGNSDLEIPSDFGFRISDFPGYEILEELGRGGMGVVYKARQLGLNRLVALKMIPADACASSQTRARFRAEAVAVGRLQHPHIVGVHDSGEHRGQPYFSLELVEGGTLAQKLAGQPQPAGDAACLVETLARAVHHAHQHGVIHRDLKPANILLDGDGAPKISDFGLAKSLEDDSSQTRTGTIVGTPNYMAPEQATGSLSAVGPAADIYALGVILYEMLTGRPPFCARTPLDTLELVRTQEPVPPRRLQPATPRDLETICLQCLAKEPRKRYTSALDLADDLARFRAGKPILARPVHALERSWRWCRRNPAPAILLTCIVLLLAVLAAGASLAAWKLDRARDRAVSHQQAAELAKEEVKEQLWNALLSQAQAKRWSGRAGRNLDSLDVLKQAAALHPSLELRNEAIACMVLPDLRPAQKWDCGIPHYYGLAFDAELKRYAFSDEKGAISIRRLADNHELLRLPGGGVPAWILQFSPDGRFLASRCHCRNGDSDTIHLWDIDKAIHSGGAEVPSCRRLIGQFWDFHPDNRHVAVSRGDRSLWMYDLLGSESDKELGRDEPTWRLAFDPKGNRLAVASIAPIMDSGEWIYPIFVHDAATGKRQVRLRSPAVVRGLCWRDDGRRLAGAAADRNVYIWEPPSERPLRTLIGHQSDATQVAYHPRGELLASIGWDSVVRLWDAETGRHLLSSPAAYSPLRFSGDGRHLALALDVARIGICDLAQGRVCRALRVSAKSDWGYWGAAYHPHKPLLASAGSDGVRLWDAVRACEIAFQPLPDCQSVLFLADGDLLTGSSAGLDRWHVKLSPTIPEGGAGLERLPNARLARHKVGRLAISADGHTLVVSTPPGALMFPREQAQAPATTLAMPNAFAVALSPDCRWVALGTRHGSGTCIWDLQSGRKVGPELPGGDAYAAFSPDGRWLVNGTEEEYRFLEVGSWRPGLRIPRAAPATLGPLAFTTDGKMLAIAHSLRDVRLIETATGRELATLAAPEPRPIRWLCFRPDGEQLAVVCEDRVLQLWDLRPLRERLADMGLDWE